ncbi:hypothetical protein BVRB_6g147750 [Beta vulgaris subsp. vulgaris]|nr:hypothetical protein BVRB_6g147750 [Beta vulgaris subsp. vulgaris]
MDEEEGRRRRRTVGLGRREERSEVQRRKSRDRG